MSTHGGKILIIGRNGQLSRSLQRSLLARGTAFSVLGSRESALATEPLAIGSLIARLDPRAIINASAYTDVNAAEKDTVTATALNARAPAIMAAACKTAGIPFIHISTDYVFDGTRRTPYRPTYPTAPLNVYGHSKAAGERAIIAAGGDAVILRTSWVYDGTGKNFLTTMLRLAQERGAVSVVDDQIGRPTYAGHLAEASLAACHKRLTHRSDTPQIYHYTDGGDPISWYDFAREIFAQARITCQVTPVPAATFPSPAKRPAYSVLDCHSFVKDFGFTPPDWRGGIDLALWERRAHA